MTLAEFVEMCQKRDWTALVHFLSSDIKDMSFKITASAVIGAYHPDVGKAKEYGLEVWDTLLSEDPVAPMLSLMTSAVDLSDFTNAYALAHAKNGLNDDKVAQSIVSYVKLNKLKLGSLLDSEELPEQYKAIITEAFGDLSLTKAQKEAYFKKQFLKQAKEKISFIQSTEKIKMELEKILELKPNKFNLSYTQPSSMRGIYSSHLGSPGEISFASSVTRESAEKGTEKLKKLNIGVNFYDMTWRKGGKGIQLWDKPQEMAKKLAEAKESSLDEKKHEDQSSSLKNP